jgi:GxxExxY protein
VDRIHILVAESIVLDVTTVETLAPVHQAQLSTYPTLSGRRLGFLMNFNVSLFKQGLKRRAIG